MFGIETVRRTAQRWIIQSESRPVVGQTFPVIRYLVVDGTTIIDTDYGRVIAIRDNPYRIHDSAPLFTAYVWSDEAQWGIDCVYLHGRLIAYDVYVDKYLGVR